LLAIYSSVIDIVKKSEKWPKMKNKLLLVLIIVLLAIAWSCNKSGEEKDGNASQQTQYERDLQEIERPQTTREVIESLKQRVENNPNDAIALAYLGDMYFGISQFHDAVKYYAMAININPRDVDTHNDIGLANHYIGSSDIGLRHVEEGIKVDPSFQRIWLTKGFILAATGRIDEARNAWEQVLIIDPDSDVATAAASFLSGNKSDDKKE